MKQEQVQWRNTFVNKGVRDTPISGSLFNKSKGFPLASNIWERINAYVVVLVSLAFLNTSYGDYSSTAFTNKRTFCGTFRFFE